jgi:hypothetical protein
MISKLGYTVNSLDIRIKNGVQVVNTLSSFLGPFDGLNSTYKTKWKGPWVGVREEFDVSQP